MHITIADAAALIDGRVVGDANQALTGVSSLAEAGPGDISFLANPRYAPLLQDTKASCVLVAEEFTDANVAQIVVDNPDWAFAKVVQAHGPQPRPMATGVHPAAVIGDGVQIADDVTVGAYAVVADEASLGAGTVIHPHAFVGADAQLGESCVIFPHVTVREGCELGDRVIVHSGAVIGSDGFGYASVHGVHHKIPQVGIVVLGDDVEIGANTTIDRARFGKTIIGKGSKIDNLVQIAHNVEIGEHCIIVSQVGIAGSTVLENYVTMGGQSGSAGHIEIGAMSMVAARAGVTKSLPARSVVAGFPARDHQVNKQEEVASRRLPRLQQTIRDMQQRLEQLEAKLGEAKG